MSRAGGAGEAGSVSAGWLAAAALLWALIALGGREVSETVGLVALAVGAFWATGKGFGWTDGMKAWNKKQDPHG